MGRDLEEMKKLSEMLQMAGSEWVAVPRSANGRTRARRSISLRKRPAQKELPYLSADGLLIMCWYICARE